ncbi:MAG: 3-phosphoshikimate 1-carboxyvinyltransferase [Dehalococcoidia bacterium]|nr:3-phosphoshikimate 1-carboxyvinyltransferase [Dehalococcoidia bacterium]
MEKNIIRTNQLKGIITPPGDKSISHRALMFNAIADKKARITGLLESDDIQSTIDCLKLLGVDIKQHAKGIYDVKGVGINGLQLPSENLNCGNSGTTMRLLIGLLSSINGQVRLVGDQSLQSRPMDRVYDYLNQIGGKISSENKNGCAPIIIEGSKIKNNDPIKLKIASAQIKSAILLASLTSRSRLELIEPIKSRDHSERLLIAMGVDIQVDDKKIKIEDFPSNLQSLDIEIPGDISAAAPWIVAALIHPNAEIQINNVGLNATRAGIIDIFLEMGGNISIMNKRVIGNEEVADLIVRSSELNGVSINKELIPRAIDEIPLVALAACFAKNKTTINDIDELKVKESNRLVNTIDILSKFGGNVTSQNNKLIIHGVSKLNGCRLICNIDHRMIMLAGIAACVSEGESTLINVESVGVSYPNFWDDFHSLVQ